ncbi:hypothetical protein Salat_1370200 [Sesamum alatum]|uniref:Uncharacterized protein n=1 Tax=Sesamum alatum TaxID=300844 RepID=A0AAE2CKY6_9LAMI|nr:hypothetical protein Salat_1370200 [Sesamum alatum]
MGGPRPSFVPVAANRRRKVETGGLKAHLKSGRNLKLIRGKELQLASVGASGVGWSNAPAGVVDRRPAIQGVVHVARNASENFSVAGRWRRGGGDGGGLSVGSGGGG